MILPRKNTSDRKRLDLAGTLQVTSLLPNPILRATIRLDLPLTATTESTTSPIKGTFLMTVRDETIHQVSLIWGPNSVRERERKKNSLLHSHCVVGPYDIHDAENADGIMESSNKNLICCIAQNVAECAKFWMDKLKVSQHSSIKMRYGLVSVNIKLKINYLNMNPAYSACRCVNEWRRCAVSFTTYTEAHVMLAMFSASVASVYEYMNICSESHFKRILPFLLRKKL